MRDRNLTRFAARRLAALCMGAGWIAAVSPSMAGESDCGTLANAYGPFNYVTQKKDLEVVEKYHFQPEFEALTGPLVQYAAGDHDYVLRASPNHHRALMAMSRNVERLNNPKPNGAKWSVDCYFDRAMRFAPDDMIVRMLYARYLGRNKRLPEARNVLEYVARTAVENPFTQYNVGVLYLDFKIYDRALQQAHRAAAMGMQKPELRNALKAAGQWSEPPAQAPVQAASAPASAASGGN